jgi:cobalt-zinc-cadmium efflux system protein
MFTDVAALGLALFAIRFAERPATPERTFGYYRVEILAALANAVFLIVLSGLILFEAGERLFAPLAVEGKLMFLVASAGLLVNAAGILLLRHGAAESMNVKAAYLEVLSDALSAAGVIAAGAIVWSTGWPYADPIVSGAIGLFILPRTWGLLREAVGVLLEGTPAHVNLTTLRAAMEAVPGVETVHDLHVWTITSGMHALSAHAALLDSAAAPDVLERLRQCAARFEIGHVTIQLEGPGCRDPNAHP